LKLCTPVGCNTMGAALLAPALRVMFIPARRSNCNVCVTLIAPLMAVMSTLKEPALTTAVDAMKFKLTFVPKPDTRSVEEVGEAVTPAGN
jgi:hypothetical protein